MQFDYLRIYLDHFLNSSIILNIKSGNYQWQEIRAIGASMLFLLFLFCAFRGRRLSLGSLFWYYWFMIVGLGGLFVEMYWLVFIERVHTGPSVLDIAIRMYSEVVDSRILNGGLDFRILALICAFVSSPLALLVGQSIQQQTTFQYPAQLIVSTARFVFHSYLLVTNLVQKFVYTSVVESTEKEISMLRLFNSNSVRFFVAFHGVLMVGSFISAFKSLLKMYYANYDKQTKRH